MFLTANNHVVDALFNKKCYYVYLQVIYAVKVTQTWASQKLGVRESFKVFILSWKAYYCTAVLLCAYYISK